MHCSGVASILWHTYVYNMTVIATTLLVPLNTDSCRTDELSL
jgi:hypothetical protein